MVEAKGAVDVVNVVLEASSESRLVTVASTAIFPRVLLGVASDLIGSTVSTNFDFVVVALRESTVVASESAPSRVVGVFEMMTVSVGSIEPITDLESAAYKLPFWPSRRT